ncbi:MAG: nuclear transport factor 2 family protein [Porphyrobacter sp.]|nr:nuclear transport factor 2 family protein [Porphyrobacter sp.]
MIRRLLLALAVLLFTPVAHAQDDLARETAKVEDLRSIREIKRLQAEWGYRAMAGDWKGMAALGTDYLEMVLPGGNTPGREAVEQWLRERMGQGVDGMPAGRLNLRVWISPVITLSAMGDRAIGRWHQIALTGEAGKSAEWRGTTDVIEYHKTRDGWRIAFIRPYLNFVGPYEGGWRHDAATLERAPYHYTPDEAGVILPDREAERPRPGDELAREASLLLRQGTAQNLANAFGYYLDRGMYDDIADLFAADCQIDVAGQGVYNGTAGVRKFLSRFGEPGLDPGELNDRPLLMPLVNVSDDGSTALVRVVELGMTGQHGGEGYWSAAIDTFLLRADERGHWRIAQLHIRPLMRANYKQGWAHPLPAAMPIGESQWPDGPPQPVDLSYPEHAFAMQQLPPGVIFPAREPGGQVTITANALEMAEAFDGAENVSNAYGYYIDQFAWRNTADLFARDGWKELSYIGTFIGKDHVLKSLIQRYGEGGPNDAFQAIHQKTQPFVSVYGDGSRAFVRTRLMQFNSSSTAPGSWIGGIYENQVVKEDGVWRIHGMDLDYVWLADYATGWTGIDPEASKRFAPTAEQLAAFGPDAPLRGETFAPYPRIAPMGFHFANPVSGREPETRLTWSDGRRAEK